MVRLMEQVNYNTHNNSSTHTHTIKAEIKVYHKSRDKRIDMIKELQAELQAVNDDYNNDHKVHNEYEDGLLAEINELKAELDKDKEFAIETSIKNDKLQAENVELKEGLSNEGVTMLQVDNKRLLDANKKRLNEIIELQAEIKAYINAREGRINTINNLNKINDRLVKQVSSNRDNNSNVHTISGEIAEYMENNDKCNGARLFIIPMEEFDEDECCRKWFTWDEGVE